jgi:short-subunit dehydrogenase
MPVMGAGDVARLGYQGLTAGRRVVITGLVNKIIAMSTRFSPPSMLLAIASHLSRREDAAGVKH